MVGELRRSALSDAVRPFGRQVGRTINSILYGSAEFARKLREPEGFLPEVLSKQILPLAGFGANCAARPIRMSAAKLLGIIGK